MLESLVMLRKLALSLFLVFLDQRDINTGIMVGARGGEGGQKKVQIPFLRVVEKHAVGERGIYGRRGEEGREVLLAFSADVRYPPAQTHSTPVLQRVFAPCFCLCR